MSKMTEFLPLCDVLFNVISLAGYFCDVVFDVVLSYALFERGRFGYFAVVMSLILSSLIISQIISLRWYCNSIKQKDMFKEQNNEHHSKDHQNYPIKTEKKTKLQQYIIIFLHIAQVGVLWRYAKLFVPVNLRRVKHEVRDLCMLRLVHAFCEAAPMLLIQLYLFITIQNDSKSLLKMPDIKFRNLGGTQIIGIISHQPNIVQHQTERTFKDLNVVSTVLSLFSVCWALASFNKNVRLQNVHRLVLTWLGVIFQFFWRLGTVTSRITSLTVYASFYKHWVFLVIILHWFSMFFWLISPKNVFHGERISKLRKTMFSALIAFVYIFAYINLQEVNHRQKMITFYVVMFLENLLLVCLWLAGIWHEKPKEWYIILPLVFGTFVLGILFMLLYYRFFHIRRLKYDNNRYEDQEGNEKCVKYGNREISHRRGLQPAGVFNCRFSNPVGNGATKRKKKKPTTFIPPPVLVYSPQVNTEVTTTRSLPIPFWRRSHAQSQTGGSSENEGSAGSRVNIQQKLHEKKQKQLAELKIIEEEIKQGKLVGPTNNSFGIGEDGRQSLPKQPIPRTKKHINLDPIEWCSIGSDFDKRFNDLDEVNNLNKFTSQYNQIYSSFGLSEINIPALDHTNNQNKSPIPSSQVSAAESNSLTRKIPPRTKMPNFMHKNIFAENYRIAIQNQTHSISSPNRTGSPTINNVFDHLNSQNLFSDINHPREISGVYINKPESGNNRVDTLSFPYNVVPPPRSKLDNRSTPLNAEVLLAPHYLENSRAYFDWIERAALNVNENEIPRNFSSGDENMEISAADDSVIGITERNIHRIPSDIDSQVSLPRSYTLPREFKYYRRNRGKRIIKADHFITSTNSSDGDVDSGDDNESDRCSDVSQRYLRKDSNSRISHSEYHKTAQNIFKQRNPCNTSSVNPTFSHEEPILIKNGTAVNNLDLINGVEFNFNNYSNRQSRLRTHAGTKHMMLPWRHETKL